MWYVKGPDSRHILGDKRGLDLKQIFKILKGSGRWAANFAPRSLFLWTRSSL